MNSTAKILCVADEVDLLVYSSSIKERFGDVDLVLSAGDLPDEYLGYISSMLNKPLLSVSGNHDPVDKPPRRTAYSLGFGSLQADTARSHLGRLSFSIRTESGVRVLGIPGSMLYNGGPHQYSEFSMALRIMLLAPRLALARLLKGRAVDIILAHAPPYSSSGPTDLCHRGFKSFNWLISLASPRYFIHGHVHVYDSGLSRETISGGTAIVNVYGHRVLTLSPGATS